MDFNEIDTENLGRTRNRDQASTASEPTKRLRIRYKKLSIVVNSNNADITGELRLDTGIKKIKSVAITATNDDRLIQSLNIGMTISGIEIVPADVEAKLFFAYPSVPITDRFFQLDQDAGNGTISIRLKDNGGTIANNQAYTVSLTFQCLSE